MGDNIITATENPMTDIMESLKKAAWISENTSRQMGLLNDTVAEHERQIQDLTHRMEVRERRETVDQNQSDQIKLAVHDRICGLLEIDHENGHIAARCIGDYKKYYRGFVCHCYNDCKAHGRMGKPYYRTLAIDYDDVINYINAWFPRGGVEDYKHYLDDLHSA